MTPKFTYMLDTPQTKEEKEYLERRKEERDQDFINKYTPRLQRMCGDIIEVKKGTFPWAMQMLIEGKKVRASNWKKGAYIVSEENEYFVDEDEWIYDFSKWDYVTAKWELAE